MSSTGQATSPIFDIQLIIDALADYTERTGIDLSQVSFAAALEQSNSPEAILELLQGQERAFKEDEDDNRSLKSCLGPSVKVLHAFSGILVTAVSMVSNAYNLLILFNVTSSGLHRTSKCFDCCNQCSPWCMSFDFLFFLFACNVYKHTRLPMGLRQTLMPSSIFSSA